MTITLASPVETAQLSDAPSAVAQLTSIDFWRTTFPRLQVETLFSSSFTLNELTPARADRTAARLNSEGYFQETDEALVDLSARLSEGIASLVEMGIPPVFAFVFDEAWAVFHRQHTSISRHLGDDYQILPDFWAWHVDPTAGQAGWRPHRDKGHEALRDGAPLSLTVWVPLTEATPQNGCMYILPANFDPVYGTPNDRNWSIDYPSIRALPGKPGDWFCWNQAVLHWGGKTTPFADGPRMSMALEFQRADTPPMNQPLMGHLSVLDFPSRIKLIAKQILQYQHMYPLPQAMRDFAQAALA